MNQQLIKINENLGAVSDEHGNIKLIDKTTNTYSFQEILEIENEIEDNDIGLNNIEKEIKKTTDFILCHTSLNIGSLLFAFLMVIDLILNLNIHYIGFYLITIGLIELPAYSIFGSQTMKKRKLEEMQKMKIEISSNQEVLKKNLQIMQRKVQYHDYNSQNNLTYMTDFNNEQNHNNIQVLSLKRSKRY